MIIFFLFLLYHFHYVPLDVVLMLTVNMVSQTDVSAILAIVEIHTSHVHLRLKRQTVLLLSVELMLNVAKVLIVLTVFVL